MTDLGTILSVIERSWMFSVPVMALVVVTILWVGFVRAQDPPALRPRRMVRVGSPDLVSVTVREVRGADLLPSMDRMWWAVDRVLSREHGTTLAELPLAPRWRRRSPVPHLRSWRALRRRLVRARLLSQRVVLPAEWPLQGHRDRQRKEFGRLVGELSAQIDGLPASIVAIGGSA